MNLKVNVSPSLQCGSPLDYRIKSMLFSDMLYLVGVNIGHHVSTIGRGWRRKLKKQAETSQQTLHSCITQTEIDAENSNNIPTNTEEDIATTNIRQVRKVIGVRYLFSIFVLRFMFLFFLYVDYAHTSLFFCWYVKMDTNSCVESRKIPQSSRNKIRCKNGSALSDMDFMIKQFMTEHDRRGHFHRVFPSVSPATRPLLRLALRISS